MDPDYDHTSHMIHIFKKLLLIQTAFWIMVLLNGAVIFFHVAVLTGIIPIGYVWGGKLASKNDMYVFETLSLAINFLIGWILLSKWQPNRFRVSARATNILLYMLSVVFLINTVGNLFAASLMERLIATPLTLLAAICCARMAIEEKLHA